MSTYATINILSSPSASVVIEDIDVLNCSLYNILFTEPGTDVYRPEYGIGVQNWLFTCSNTIIRNQRVNELKQAIKRWENRLTLGDVNIQVSGNIGYITIEYTPNSPNLKNSKNFSFSLSLQRSGINAI